MSVDAEKTEEFLYANHAVIDIFGCRDLDDNQFLRIEEQLGASAVYPQMDAFHVSRQ